MDTKPRKFIHHRTTSSFNDLGVLVIGRVAIPIIMFVVLWAISAVVSAIWGLVASFASGDWANMYVFYWLVAPVLLFGIGALISVPIIEASEEVRDS